MLLLIFIDHFRVFLVWMNLSFAADCIDAELNTNQTEMKALPNPEMSNPLI